MLALITIRSAAKGEFSAWVEKLRAMTKKIDTASDNFNVILIVFPATLTFCPQSWRSCKIHVTTYSRFALNADVDVRAPSVTFGLSALRSRSRQFGRVVYHRLILPDRKIRRQ